MLVARIAFGLLVVACGLTLFWIGTDSNRLTWVGVGVVLLGLMLAFWLGAEAWPLAAVALAAALASVGLASFTESGPSRKPASQAGTEPTTAPTGTTPTVTPPTRTVRTNTAGTTRTNPTTSTAPTSPAKTAPPKTTTTPSPAPKHKPAELPRTL